MPDYVQIQRLAQERLQEIQGQLQSYLAVLEEQKEALLPLLDFPLPPQPNATSEYLADVLVRLEVGQRILGVTTLSVETVLPIAIAHVDRHPA